MTTPPHDARPELADLVALSDDAIAALPFEDAYRLLEAAVGLLEADGLPLEVAMQVFQRGMALTRRCGRELDASELRVREVEAAEG